MTGPVVLMCSDPPTVKKPPMGADSRFPPSLEKTATQPVVQSQLGQLKNVQLEKEAVTPASVDLNSREAEVDSSPAFQKTKESLMEDPTPCAAGMKSRLQRLVEQRKGWDGQSKNILCAV